MPRKRLDQITEPLETLLSLEETYLGKAQETRIRMLRLLKEYPSMPLSEVGSLVGCSERSVHRWLKMYYQEGIDALLQITGEEPRARVNKEVLEELRQQLRSGNMASLNEVQGWLKSSYGVEYSLKGVANLLQNRLKARRVWMVP